MVTVLFTIIFDHHQLNFLFFSFDFDINIYASFIIYFIVSVVSRQYSTIQSYRIIQFSSNYIIFYIFFRDCIKIYLYMITWIKLSAVIILIIFQFVTIK